jgi:hypothetical protein
MAEGLFDQRYRYDYIYPRGRSGETLRAVDLQEGDRPVVIKRPAPQDAPPIRAGQEVSILNERKALAKLAGHPVATALLGGGQFTAGGMAHQYIVMERAEGAIVADMVSELAQRGERLPELEMLVIIDSLLDLLYAAHQQEIIYNDVDAKHLFWDREKYRLKIIDWGNAVFLEGDEVTAQGISRQTDVYQVGELLYFILTGGARADVPRSADEDFRVDFGHDAPRISPRLAAIVSRALHPNPRQRTGSIAELRRELSDLRVPLERERSAVVARAVERLRRELSKEELIGLLRALEPALAMDPGFPAARQVTQEVQHRLSDLDVAADLDAARIYLQSGAWARALPILDELRPRARGGQAALIGLLSDWSRLLIDAGMGAPPLVIETAIALAFEARLPDAAAHLITNPPDQSGLGLLLAERISAHAPEILLLRPNLFRLETALAHLEREGIAVNEPRTFLKDIVRDLDALSAGGGTSLIALRDGYRALVDQMTALNKFLGTVRTQHQLTNRRLPLSSLDRAINATMALADNMHIIGKQATGSPRDALGALEASRAIDPANRTWDAVRRLLDRLYELLGSYQTYVPVADGSDLAGWLNDARADLAPFVERLFDEMLVGMTLGLKLAGETWETYAEAVVQGDRAEASSALSATIDAVSTVAPALGVWLNQLRAQINSATYIERFALYGGLGRALADGWEQFDRGKLTTAEQLGAQAYDIARSEAERDAARRLRELSAAAREWLDRGGISDRTRTEAALVQVEQLYSPDEIAARDQFGAQMPSNDTYLRAVGKGFIDPIARTSTAAPRIFFVNAVLFGVLDAHADALDDAAFWRGVALVAMPSGVAHPLVSALDGFIARRRDLIAAGDLLNSINGVHALKALDRTRTALEENPHARLLSAAIHSLREIAAALRDWSDGEFRAAGNKLENALRAIDETESSAGITLTGYRAWLMSMVGAAAELHTSARRLAQIVDRRDADPQPDALTIHREFVTTTARMIGAEYTTTLVQWRDTYEQFLAVYTDSARRSARLARFNDLFRAMFIDRHPAYPLYRHWYDLTEAAPEFPPPPTDQPVPALRDADPDDFEPQPYTRVDADPDDAPPERPARRVPVVALIAAAAALGMIGLALFLVFGRGGDDAAQRLEPTPIVGALLVTDEASPSPDAPTPTTPAPTRTPSPPPVAAATLPPAQPATPIASPTPLPTLTPIVPTDTPAPTLTPSPSATATPSQTPSATPTVTLTFTPSPPPDGVRGDQNLLTLVSALNPALWGDAWTRAIDRDAWRVGIGTPETGDDVLIAVPLEALEGRYGADAARRIMRLTAEIELVTYNPPLVVDQGVYFGLMLSPPNAPARGQGVQVSLAQPGVFNIGQRRDGTATVNVQRSVGAPIARVRLERDVNSGLMAVYVNDEQIGTPIRLESASAPVIPVLFVRRGGVIVYVSRWTVTLR